MSTTTKTAVGRIANVIVAVGDQDAMLDFYTGKLGLELRADVPFGNDYRWVEVAPADAETTIAIVRPPEGKPAGNSDTGIALHTDDIRADHAELKAAGVDVDAEVSDMGDPVPPMFWFRDQDNNTLMVVEVRS